MLKKYLNHIMDKNISIEKYQEEIRTALLIRQTEMKLLDLFAKGKLFGTVHTCIGQEFIGVAVARSLQPQDTMFTNHRGHGHYLARTNDTVGLIAEIMGKSIGVCGGRGGSQHLYKDNFFSNGIQGGIVPVAAGLAIGQTLKNNNGVSVVFIGDGTLGEGIVYETLNIASKWNLPLLFVCENNLYAQSTPQNQTIAGDILSRASAFGIETKEVNTWEYENLFESIDDCVKYVREKNKPLFCKVDTYRLMAHSKGDDNRPKEEIEKYWAVDPLQKILNEFGNTPEYLQLLNEVETEINNAVTEAENSSYGSIKKTTSNLVKPTVNWKEISFEKDRGASLVRKGLENGLSNDDNVIIIGEDIESPYGGAFKCTTGLSDKFTGRVRNTPISEAAITGIGNGLALAGLKPVVEIMFGDFLTLTIDQWINHAAKFRWMYNDQVEVPLILRTPMGGKRGYGPTHSQCIEKHFIGVPGTRVLCLNHRYSPELLYKNLFSQSDLPTLVIENKVLYGKDISSEPPIGFNLFSTDDDFPVVNLKPKLPTDITIVAIGGISLDSEDAIHKLFYEEEIVSDLFMPTQLYPFSIEPLKNSLSSSRKLLIVEEGQGFASVSSEIIALVGEEMSHLQIQCKRVAAAVHPIATSRPLEEDCIPNIETIFKFAKDLYNETSN
jgi:2-oxoisovalerate dehydrogenase E1 component